MVGVFRRSLSFPTKINPSRNPPKRPISQHIRSVSLPVRSHPLISQLNDEVSRLRSGWLSGGINALDWLIESLRRLNDVHDCFSKILQLPQTEDCLRNRRSLVENLLEDLLRFVDVYGTFRTSVLTLRELQAASQMAIRRKDEAKIALHSKSRRRIAKQIGGLSSSIRRRAKTECHVVTSYFTVAEAELAAVITDVSEATVAVSLALFNGVNSAFGCGKTKSCASALLTRRKRVEEEIEEVKASGLRKMKEEEVGVALMKMRELEEGILGIERGSEKVFRSLINTRVSLLNILTK